MNARLIGQPKVASLWLATFLFGLTNLVSLDLALARETSGGTAQEAHWVAHFSSTTRSISLRGIENRFRTPNDVIRGLNSLTRELHAVGDHRALFAGVYAMAFASGARDLHSGGYYDPSWIRKVMVNHANVYRRTILTELQGDRRKLSRSWRYAFEYSQRSSPPPRTNDRRQYWAADHDLVYTTHAHIMGDLVMALLQTPTDYHSSRLKHDFERITSSLHSVMPQIWAYYRSYPGATSIGERFSQRIIGGWIANLRTDAWDAAAVLSQLGPRERALALARLDAKVARKSAVKGVLMPLLNHKVPGS